MSDTTPHAPTLAAVPHLRRAEAVLYLILYYLFGHIHPRYQAYIDALAAHDRLAKICRTAATLDACFGLSEPQVPRPRWRETNLPEIYFTLIFAPRLVRLLCWVGLSKPALAYQIFPSLTPD